MDEFNFRIRNGELSNTTLIRNHIQNMPDGEYVLQIRKASRSLSQNNLYWKWVGILAQSLGYGKNEMHEALLEAFSYPMTYKNLDGRPSRRKLRTSEMTVDDMKAYMNDIEVFAHENGVMLPLPEERYLINNIAVLEYGKK